MARPQLSAEPRVELGKQVSQLRRVGLLPGVVYGGGQQSQAITLNRHEFELLHRNNGRNAVLDLMVVGEEKTQPVLLHEVQVHPVSRVPIHVDLLVVNLGEEMTVDVPIVPVGDSLAVDRMGGVLLHLRDTVSVRAKPDDLPSAIELDISSLDSFEALLYASDLAIPAGVTLLTEQTEPVMRVQPPRVEEGPVAAEEGEGVVEAPAEAPAEAGSTEGAQS